MNYSGYNFIFVVAKGKNNAIGQNGTLPWHLPADLRHFRRITEGHTIIMGRKTFESLPGILPNRHHIIITRNKNFKLNDNRVTIFNSLESMTEALELNNEYFVIGGAEIFGQLLPLTNKIYMTEIDREFKADTFFPELDEQAWIITDIKEGITDENNIYPHRFITLERKNKQTDI